MTFKCDFGKGVTCEMVVADEPPAKGTSHVQRIEWAGVPTRKTLRHYVPWMNSVNKMLADKWRLRLMHVYELPKGRYEIWAYKPGARPERVDT